MNALLFKSLLKGHSYSVVAIVNVINWTKRKAPRNIFFSALRKLQKKKKKTSALVTDILFSFKFYLSIVDLQCCI